MTVVAIAAPTVVLSDAQLLNGVAVPVLASAGTSLTGNTGFTVAWVPNTIVYVVGATSNTITLTFTGNGSPSSPSITTAALTAAVAYFFGPVGNGYNIAGLITVTVTGVITGARAGAYLAPMATGTSHNPFEVNPQNADY